MQPHRTAMTAVDRSWLRMESVENPMMISAVLSFDQPIAISRLKRVLNERFLTFRRFRQRVVNRGDRAYWEDDPHFDIDNHIHRIALPGNGSQEELQQLVSDLNSTALNFNRPLWHLHYIDQYNGGCALLIRIHHCIADGISLVRVLLSLTDSSPEYKVHTLTPLRPAPGPRASLWRQSVDRLRASGHVALEQGRLFLQSLEKDPGYPLKLMGTASDIAVDCIKLGFAREEPHTSLKRPLSGRKQVAWARPLDLADVKRCARTLKGTVNDVLLSVASGALHKHFNDTGEAIPDCGIRVAVPFNLRPLNRPITDLGNQFGLVLVPLPVDVPCPIMRFRQTRENMNRLKRSYQAQVTYSLLDLFGRGPDILERRALNMLSHKASAVLTNVPGPKQPVYLAGAKMTQPMFWVPQSGDIGIGMSIFSYAGTVQFGITVDKSIPADPSAIMDHFHEAFDELVAQTTDQQANLGVG
ncbi:WS/DGAT/MGAT family O-acyltransferase [Marinobacter zhejiangensis]|uniref:diacylglycerol O-acyltransferase n=1 Tax=Marinobacter zhejiangensis TaxID=488535 RepID=A0A1I4KVR4_9GAMM|nr:wax ester/triacylglycerol synthase family O-acyltransferase [Marinobacter zhejiangensis]SFL82850.1 acyltransferase, WS/DGAT/MGAT [Marinobacter zhejiangensis]